jgi:hypothetical protein
MERRIVLGRGEEDGLYVSIIPRGQFYFIRVENKFSRNNGNKFFDYRDVPIQVTWRSFQSDILMWPDSRPTHFMGIPGREFVHPSVPQDFPESLFKETEYAPLGNIVLRLELIAKEANNVGLLIAIENQRPVWKLALSTALAPDLMDIIKSDAKDSSGIGHYQNRCGVVFANSQRKTAWLFRLSNACHSLLRGRAGASCTVTPQD